MISCIYYTVSSLRYHFSALSLIYYTVITPYYHFSAISLFISWQLSCVSPVSLLFVLPWKKIIYIHTAVVIFLNIYTCIYSNFLFSTNSFKFTVTDTCFSYFRNLFYYFFAKNIVVVHFSWHFFLSFFLFFGIEPRPLLGLPFSCFTVFQDYYCYCLWIALLFSMITIAVNVLCFLRLKIQTCAFF